MSQLKAKQLKLPEVGSLLIGGTGGTGTTISPTGNTDKILRIVAGSPAWSLNDRLTSANGFNTVTATDATGVSLKVQNAAGTAAVELAKFSSGSAGDEKFNFSSTAGKLTIAATGAAANIDVVIAPQGTGDVIIGNSGGGIIQADDGEDLAIRGGSGAGNLLLNGGGTGKLYYSDVSTDATREIATVGDVTVATNAAKVTQTRTEFTGAATTFSLAAKTIDASVIPHINGLAIKKDFYTVDPSTKVVSFTGLPYTLDAVDQVVFTYEIAA
jgi:hypothetical protein